MVKAAFLESRRSRVRAPLWLSSFKETNCFFPAHSEISNIANRDESTCNVCWDLFSSLTVHCHIHPLQAANCCRNSRLVVDEEDFKWVKKKMSCISKPVSWKYLF